jgi:MFS family permease
METSLGISKAVGDVMGVAMFAILLGAGRIGFSRYGKHIMRVLFIGMIGAAACYFTVALSGNVIVAFIACIFTGLFTSMLWPGSLIMMEENIPGVGVAAFALMAAGGDLGGSVSPQLMGIVIDKVSVVSGEAAGMKAGMLVCGFFPLIGAVLVAVTMRYFFAMKRKKTC